MPLVKLTTAYYTRRPDMISQYSVVKKKHMQWLCQVNDTTLMSMWPMDPKCFIMGYTKYRYTGMETDFVAIARKGSTQYTHKTSHWWFFKWNGDMFCEVCWNGLDTDQQLTVVRVFMRHNMRGTRPWGDDMEVLVALEQA